MGNLDYEDVSAEDRPEKRTAIIGEYEGLPDQLHAAGAVESLRSVGQLSQTLARFNISPWGQGLDFYVGEGEALAPSLA